MGQELHLKIDLDQLKEVSLHSVRRAAAFLAIGLNSTADWRTQSLSLGSHSTWRFLPEPATEALLEEATFEYRNWVIGNSLRELDSGFNIFLDQAWNALSLALLSGTRIRSDHVVKSIEADTNAASKYEKLIRASNAEPKDLETLRSISNLRNRLSHARGLVTARHANTNGELIVRWLGLETRLHQDGKYVVIPSPVPPQGIRVSDPDKPAEVVAVVVQRERKFRIGHSVSLEPAELHEICWGYLVRTDEIISAILAEMGRRGVALASPAQSENARAP